VGSARISQFLESATPGMKLVAGAVVGLVALSGAILGLATDGEFRAAIWDAKWELAIPAIVIVPLSAGWAQIPEAAALCALYVLIIEVAVYKDIDVSRDLLKLTRESMTLVGAIFVKIFGATLLTAYFIYAEIPTQLFEWMSTWVHSPQMFLLVMNVALLLVGCLMDIFSAIIVVVPLIAPAAAQFNIDPYHLGVIFLLNLEVGYLLPPAGLNLFIAAFRFNRPITEIYSSVGAFIGLMALTLGIVSYVPSLTVVPGREPAAATEPADPLGEAPALDPLGDTPAPAEAKPEGEAKPAEAAKPEGEAKPAEAAKPEPAADKNLDDKKLDAKEKPAAPATP
jgi:tripartite ATP-independent transporter DctM subunit